MDGNKPKRRNSSKKTRSTKKLKSSQSEILSSSYESVVDSTTSNELLKTNRDVLNSQSETIDQEVHSSQENEDSLAEPSIFEAGPDTLAERNIILSGGKPAKFSSITRSSNIMSSPNVRFQKDSLITQPQSEPVDSEIRRLLSILQNADSESLISQPLATSTQKHSNRSQTNISSSPPSVKRSSINRPQTAPVGSQKSNIIPKQAHSVLSNIRLFIYPKSENYDRVLKQLSQSKLLEFPTPKSLNFGSLSNVKSIQKHPVYRSFKFYNASVFDDLERFSHLDTYLIYDPDSYSAKEDENLTSDEDGIVTQNLGDAMVNNETVNFLEQPSQIDAVINNEEISFSQSQISVKDEHLPEQHQNENSVEDDAQRSSLPGNGKRAYIRKVSLEPLTEAGDITKIKEEPKDDNTPTLKEASMTQESKKLGSKNNKKKTKKSKENNKTSKQHPKIKIELPEQSGDKSHPIDRSDSSNYGSVILESDYNELSDRELSNAELSAVDVSYTPVQKSDHSQTANIHGPSPSINTSTPLPKTKLKTRTSEKGKQSKKDIESFRSEQVLRDFSAIKPTRFSSINKQKPLGPNQDILNAEKIDIASRRQPEIKQEPDVQTKPNSSRNLTVEVVDIAKSLENPEEQIGENVDNIEPYGTVDNETIAENEQNQQNHISDHPNRITRAMALSRTLVLHPSSDRSTPTTNGKYLLFFSNLFY